MKSVLVLSSSPRKNGNSDILCHQFMKDAQDAGHKTELISLYDKNTEFCRACYTCFETGRCVIKDDMESILDKMQQGEVENTKAMQEVYQAGYHV